jgi:RNA polymerase sigma-70 factor, ECF subfamily
MLIRCAQRITGNRDDAEDVVQDSLLKAILNLHRFRGDARMDTWLYAIVRNSAISRLRSCHKRHTVSLDAELRSTDLFLIHSRGNAVRSPEQSCVEGELRTLLHSEIQQLRPIYRSAIELCDIKQHSCQDAAKALNLSTSKVKARLFRGRKLLGQRISASIHVSSTSVVRTRSGSRRPSIKGS